MESELYKEVSHSEARNVAGSLNLMKIKRAPSLNGQYIASWESCAFRKANLVPNLCLLFFFFSSLLFSELSWQENTYSYIYIYAHIHICIILLLQ